MSRELLDANIIQKYYAATGTTKRFYGPSDGYTLTGGSTNNYSKRNPSLVADIWGDWREEIIMPVNKRLGNGSGIFENIYIYNAYRLQNYNINARLPIQIVGCVAECRI